jgi:hypothetical protein
MGLTNKDAGINPDKRTASLNVTKPIVVTLEKGNNYLKDQLVDCRNKAKELAEMKTNMMIEIRQK